ncbi:hypothetical protein JQV19_06080 [Sulfitobacter mediterraneus]|uniref:hypothetical protein n=1 Tax=Sulfitobacter mediterraneus TaxID=83219 RepID=UPI0019398C5D|nr:hypothetical protein [Sulfitobacter mediterraneus]MBM1556216.1 hypothetical protein [Sulfitobacter mediterraneus]MBM1567746.1 hypothetical protein [Sulfitobacter mediterraneus]MBM1571570.1 hypothetical protein [Sulfitobacter mediterraneus]MBM1575358.1 hypothetical protein [Sulfitobacter mediterraneus]MBM1579151.1 hypothetical protein [Sulfitobacter mediterraneus]
MTVFEIAINVCMLLITAAVLLYLRHLVRVSGSDPVDDPERVKRFRETAPYHLLERGN